ncbi:hypothetical protein PSTT_14587, partial [Puccinia striiformis]
MSTTRMSSRSSSQSSGDDNGSVKGSVSISERSLWPSPVTVPKYFQCREVPIPELLPHHDWRSLSSESFQFEASLPSHFNAVVFRGRIFPVQMPWNQLALMEIIARWKLFRIDVKPDLTNLVRHLESRNEAEILKASVEVVDLPKPTAPSSPQSESPIEATDTVIISTGLSMAGSSRIRELKVKRNRHT